MAWPSARAKTATNGGTWTPTDMNAVQDQYIRSDGIVESDLHAGVFAPVGVVLPYAASAAPTNWALCDGSPVSRTTYAALFALIGTTYGVGDGSTTFNLPDLRGRAPVGKGTDATVNTLGNNEGAAVGVRRPKHAHTNTSAGSHSHGGATGSTDPPNHNHNLGDVSSATGPTGAGTAWLRQVAGALVSGFKNQSEAHTHSISADGSHTHTIGDTTGGTLDTAPYIVLNYIIRIL